MRRNDFLKAMAASATGLALPNAQAAPSIKMMIPANPGGGWDTTGRALGKALIDAKVADTVQYDNKGGAAGALGLAQFLTSAKGDPNALIMMGAVMLGGIITGKPPVTITQCTPIARLTNEFNVFVLPANSPFGNMKELVAQFKKDPASVKWGGGSRGSTEHIAACMLARNVGVDPKKVNYVAFRGGGEAVAAILGGNVTVGGSGYSEFAEHIASGKMKPIGVTSPAPMRGIRIPTMSSMGFEVIIGNWRGVYGAPGITPAQRDELTKSVLAATKSASWTESVQKNAWTPAVLSGKSYEDFVEYEFSALRATMYLSGML